MNRDGAWRLSPAYDITYSVDPTAPPNSNRHSLTINGKNEDITYEDFETIALNNDIQEYKALIDGVSNAIANFEDYAKELAINEKLIESIKTDFIL